MRSAKRPGVSSGDRAGRRRSARARNGGSIQKAVAKVRAAREANVARRKDTLIGTSDFPNLAEDQADVLALPRLAALPSDQRGTDSRSGSPSLSSVCATGATSIAPSTAQGRRSSSPVSGVLRTSMRGQVFAKSLFEGGRHQRPMVEGEQRLYLAETIPKGSGCELALPLGPRSPWERAARRCRAKALRKQARSRSSMPPRLAGATARATRRTMVSIWQSFHQGCMRLRPSKPNLRRQ